MVSDGLISPKVLRAKISQCRICVEDPLCNPLPHEPRPVVVISDKAKIAICGQAPGTRVHASGIPFSDPSGERLRNWMGVESSDFYNADKFAIVPMGFCFPGVDKQGSDMPPRRECAKEWREKVIAAMPQLRLILVVGMHAHKWHFAKDRVADCNKGKHKNMTQRVSAWRDYLAVSDAPILFPLPHPSWRNNVWLKKNLWFSKELIPDLRILIQQNF